MDSQLLIQFAVSLVIVVVCVIAMAVFISTISKIAYRDTGEVFTGHFPPHSLVARGAMPGKPLPVGTPGPSRPAR